MKKPLLWYALAAFVFLYLPLIVLSLFSFNASRFTVWEGFSLRWYREALHNRQMLEAFLNSLIIGAFASVAATVIGTLAAYAIWKKRAPLLANSLYLSLLTPEIVAGVSLLAFFQFVFHFLHVKLGMHTVILAHISFSIPFAVVVILARLRNFDTGFEEAALDLGANEWDAFRLVTLPNLVPAVIASLLLCFAVSFDDYVITSLVAGVNSETLPMVIYSLARRGVSPSVNALSASVTVALGALIVAAEWLQRPAGDKP